MKKHLSILLVLVAIAMFGCGNNANNGAGSSDSIGTIAGSQTEPDSTIHLHGDSSPVDSLIADTSKR